MDQNVARLLSVAPNSKYFCNSYSDFNSSGHLMSSWEVRCTSILFLARGRQIIVWDFLPCLQSLCLWKRAWHLSLKTKMQNLPSQSYQGPPSRFTSLNTDRLLESGRDFEESGQVEVAAAASSSQIRWQLLSSHGDRPVALLLAASLPNDSSGISTTPAPKCSLEVLPTV